MPSPSKKRSKALDTFKLFPRLPTELQLKIFKLAIPPPQVVTLKTCAPESIYDIKSFLLRQMDLGVRVLWEDTLCSVAKEIRFSTKVPASGLLRACKMSREAILLTYNVAIKCADGRVIRLDGENDIVFLYHESPCHAPVLPNGEGQAYPNYPSMFLGVKTLAMTDFDFYISCPGWVLRQFKSLQALIMIDHPRLNINIWNMGDTSQSQILVLKDKAQLDIVAEQKKMLTKWYEARSRIYGDPQLPEIFVAKIKGQDDYWDENFAAGRFEAVPYNTGLKECDLKDNESDHESELSDSDQDTMSVDAEPDHHEFEPSSSDQEDVSEQEDDESSSDEE